MFRSIKTIFLSCLISSQVFANCPKEVVLLLKGEPSPCDGFLFSPEKELELRIINEDYKFLLEQSKTYLRQKELYKNELELSEQIVEKEQKKAELWRSAAEESTKKYIQSEESKGTRDWIFLLTGVGLTVLSGWAVGQVSK